MSETSRLRCSYLKKHIRVDNLIIPALQALWKLGYNTTYSCQGHEREGMFFNPYICVTVGNTQKQSDLFKIVEAVYHTKSIIRTLKYNIDLRISKSVGITSAGTTIDPEIRITIAMHGYTGEVQQSQDFVKYILHLCRLIDIELINNHKKDNNNAKKHIRENGKRSKKIKSGNPSYRKNKRIR